jgi:integrase
LNPFQEVKLPNGETRHYSRAMKMEEIVGVYNAIQVLKKDQGIDIVVTIGILFMTGLRSHMLEKIKVKDIWLDKEVLSIYQGDVKHEHIVLPIPPRLVKEIKNHIQYYDLKPDDQLLFGLSGKPLRAKQINHLTDKINKMMGWEKKHRVTPYGYRYTIVKILVERGITSQGIQYLLGHDINKDISIHHFCNTGQVIQKLQHELTAIENEIYEALKGKM